MIDQEPVNVNSCIHLWVKHFKIDFDPNVEMAALSDDELEVLVDDNEVTGDVGGGVAQVGAVVVDFFGS